MPGVDIPVLRVARVIDHQRKECRLRLQRADRTHNVGRRDTAYWSGERRVPERIETAATHQRRLQGGVEDVELAAGRWLCAGPTAQPSIGAFRRARSQTSHSEHRVWGWHRSRELLRLSGPEDTMATTRADRAAIRFTRTDRHFEIARLDLGLLQYSSRLTFECV